MPCNCDYMEPSNREIDASKVYALLDEIRTGISVDPKTYGNGMDSRVYGKKITKEDMDSLVAELCTAISNMYYIDLRMKHSLELQMWWRDHGTADKARG